MRFSAVAAAALTAAVLAGLTPSPAMAGSYPIKDRRLTHNALYRTGQFPASACRLPAPADRGHAAVRAYLNTTYACLNAVWGKHLRANGLASAKPAFTYMTSGKAPFCRGRAADIMPGAYCNPTGVIGVYLPGPVREYAPEVGFLLVMAHEYGHHVQRLTGVLQGASQERYTSKAHVLEAQRRYELQADCLAGVYIGSVWDAQKRSVPEGGALIAIAWSLGGEKGSTTNDHGSRANRARWFNKGFAAETPSACNTWTAAPATVA
ncbi:neutral zinc metallopeptidase [Nonomuraea sp. NPDC050540]|uniref:neutral zinc metallopeptidase n=1 Tax=Nonomuraea sp. NPDC050540 TaxID=3364367 RepID=UPI0037BDE0F8